MERLGKSAALPKIPLLESRPLPLGLFAEKSLEPAMSQGIFGFKSVFISRVGCGSRIVGNFVKNGCRQGLGGIRVQQPIKAEGEVGSR